MSRVRFTVFADLHHHPAWYKTDAPERLAAIQRRAMESKSEFLLHLGDFSHKPSACPELIRQYREGALPGYFVLGNHEFDIDDCATVLRVMGMDRGYYFFDRSGFRFIQLDTNYFRDFPGVFFHYSERNAFDHPKTRNWMPPEEVAWLADAIADSPYPCVLSSHAAFEYPEGNVQCNEEIRAIFRAHPGKVVLCMNGHYHRSGLDVIDGIARLDVNSASFNWVPNPHHFFPEEWYRQYECVGNQLMYADPLSAVVTIDTDAGTLDVEGSRSSFVCGVDMAKSGHEENFRPCTPDMLSAHITL